ncbi:MAG: cohesin domain-containing protein [Saprospiraceae bacterium]|nr:cohesin domain-containing protein [Saprospiraceae bacterium]
MVGGQACVEVSVENFTDILGLQFSINYDPSILEFVSVGNFGLTGLNENLMGLPTGGTQEGQITVSWIDNSLAGVSLSDGTVLFELCFNTLAGGSSEVEISNNPTSVQVLDNNDNVLPYNANAGTVNVTGGPPPPMGDDFTLIISDEFVQTSGSSVCVEVTTQNFTNILGMQFSVNYNPSKLTFESVGNFNLDGLNQNLMGLPNGNGTQAGNITVSWIDNALAGITLPDNTVLFEICFTADLTSGTTPVELSNTPTSIQILDNNDEVLMPTLVDGSVSIGNPGDGLKIDIEDATVCSDDNETFCVGVTVEDFTDILGMQFSIVYDPTDLEYSSVGNFNLDGLNANLMGLPDGGPTSTQPGVITLSWIDNALSGVSLPDGTEIFEICFEPLAPEGTTSNIEFSNMPTSIQVIDINDAQVPFIDEPGVITFDCNQFSAPVIQEPATITNNDCFGDMDGSISISVNGGSGDFSYAWSSPAGVGSVSMIDNLSAGNYTVTVTDNMSGQTAIKTYTITQPATPVTINSIDVTDIVCPGENSGAISVNASGGTGTLSYSWTPNAPATASITNLSAGEFYRVTITDANGCEEVSSFIEVAEPEAIATNAVVTDIACSGEANGSIDITPSGGTGSLFVDWDVLPDFQTSHSNLSAGTYTVTISDGNNCELVESFEITDPDPIVINEQVQDVECAGDMNGFVNLNVSGGTASAGYSIDWADAGLTDDEGTQMNLAAGSYEVTITDDNNCSIVEVIDINEPSAIELNPTVENVLCAGENSGTISLNITGGTPNPDYAINWGGPLPDGQSMQAQLPAGTYPVTVTDGNGCAEIQNITVEEPNAPIIVTAMVEDIACEGGPTGSISLSISGGTPGNAGYSIDWATLTDGEMMQENLEAGNYTVSVTDENGCETVESFVVNSDAPIFINGTVEDVSCAGESDGGISITLAGGSQNFDISWDGPGVDPLEAQQVNLGAGEYTITVTDTQSGCEKIETFEVAEPGELAATADIQNAACFAEATGSVVLDVTGGTENYTIDWSGGISQNETNPSGLLADDYMVTITDANGCTLEQTITVGEAAEISVMADLTNINCSGDETGAISISISGGTPMYTRDWTDLPDNLNTQNNLGAGTYELVITDANGCNETVSFELTEPDPIELNEVVEYVDLGNDGSVDLSTTGGVEPYTFEWSGPNTFSSSSEDLTNLNDIGEYCVTVTDANGCVYEECLDVRLRLQFGFETIQFSCGDLDNGLIDLEVLGGLEPYTFDWDVTGAADSPLLDGVGAGTYTVTVTDAEGTQITGTFEVGEYPGLVVSETLTPAQGLVNNFNGAINLNISGGAQPYDIIWDNGFTTANISGLQAGTYCVTITDANGCTFEECYIIEFIPDELEIEESIAIEANCSGDDNGRLLITVYGGIPPYTMTININGTDEVITSVNREFEIEGLAAGSYSYTVVDGNGDMVAGSETVEEPDPLTLQGFNVRHDTELTGPGIGTGRIQLNIQGGTPNYSVTWLGTPLQGPTIISLDSEIYTPQVVDSRGCTIIFPEIEVEEFAIDLEGTPAVCTGDENGAVDLVITDGDMPYTFSWELENGGTATTEDINNLPAGTYTVTVTENSGNTLVENITIGTQSNLQLEAEVATNYNGFDVSCADSADGEVSANAIFNGAACTDCDYEWVLEGELLGVNQTLTDARPGTYELTVIDPLMCENIQEVVLVAPDPLVLNSNIQEVACPGDRNGVITVMVTGGVGGFFDYDWSNGSSTFQNANLSSGTYALTVSDDNNCEVSDLFELVDPAPLEINLQIENDTDPEGCNGSVWAVVNGGFPPYTYDWSTLEVDETQALVESVCPGAYVVSVTDVRGCTQVSTVGNVLNRSFDCLEERIVITPDGNGSNDEFIINCIEELMENHLEVYNRWGQLVFETDNYDNTWEGTSQNGDVLPEGPYFFVLDYRDPITNEMTQYRGSMTILKE